MTLVAANQPTTDLSERLHQIVADLRREYEQDHAKFRGS